MGTGKLDEIIAFCEENEIDNIIFDRELTPLQFKNLLRRCEIKIMDRTVLIIDIFAKRAITMEGKLQIELARLQFLLPRLTGKGTQLSRLGGGIGTRGPGEKKIETDRRKIRERISYLKSEIEVIRKNRVQQSKKRLESEIPVIALVGYTNSGKSTLLNAITGSNVLSADKLFATLAPSTRKKRLNNGQEILIIDTVGFVQNLPHSLIAAFKSTLEVVGEADLIIHVIDSSNANCMIHKKSAEEVLADLNIYNKPILTVLNKIDLSGDDNLDVLALEKDEKPCIRISSINKYGFDELYENIVFMLNEKNERYRLMIPYAEKELLTNINKYGNVLTKEYKDNYIDIEVLLPNNWKSRVEKYLR